MEKTFRCVYGRIDVRDVGTGVGKMKSQERKDYLVAEIIEKYIIGSKQSFY